MPEADYAYGVVGAVGYAGHAGLVGAPVASAPAVVGQTHHSYAAGAPVVENRVEYGIVGQRTVQTGVQQVVAGHAYAVAGQETIPQPAHSYVAGYIEYLTPYIMCGHVETGREMARMDTTMLLGLDKTWRATPVSATLIKQTMGTCSSENVPLVI